MTLQADRPQAIADRAGALVGTPFRLHGRNPDRGLDCIGLCAQCIGAAGVKADIPNGYGLRASDADRICRLMQHLGFRQISGPTASSVSEWRIGDILLTRPAPLQLHMLVHTAEGMVHAHAGLRRVVCTPGLPDGRILHLFRLMES
ncbi:hypothetical protein SAMN02745824_0149 [Parasphingorhabdus marina DSM 22363]|uniref:NlpC/P60 family protein n=1 Tax=Parasphingorhabdus marina DSM 22363 TaxID=1123272 RepID=A0A1N6CM46_9SPHN|nr:hypothetical protein [Parasphingorhabdus marina]SIN59620.1 hypothetical protein SAMN02745824_0149 [Parasphingorhabdus marina DSM 22363]